MLDGCTPWASDAAAHYRAMGYWRGEALGAHLRRWAAVRPKCSAIVGGDQRLTYEDLDRRADILASHFIDLRLKDRDRMVVQLGNSPAFFVLIFACFRTGVIPIMALPAHRESEIAHFASHGRATAYAVAGPGRFDYLALAREVCKRVTAVKHVLVDAHDAGEFISLSRWSDSTDRGPVHPEQDRGKPDDVALFLLSGGTTGYSKLIPRTHDDYSYNFRRSSEVAGFDENTRYLAALPVSHNFPLGSPGAWASLSEAEPSF